MVRQTVATSPQSLIIKALYFLLVCTNVAVESAKLGFTSAKKMKNCVSHFVLRSVCPNVAVKFAKLGFTSA